jgi:hypothetical protein
MPELREAHAIFGPADGSNKNDTNQSASSHLLSGRPGQWHGERLRNDFPGLSSGQGSETFVAGNDCNNQNPFKRLRWHLQ